MGVRQAAQAGCAKQAAPSEPAAAPPPRLAAHAGAVCQLLGCDVALVSPFLCKERSGCKSRGVRR
eukprot:CAMPEP_0171081944 /NCGR_PEP_ID=MMETSP0766_2-20121228/16810_1 /TAXON_ID=439317 /ORGANISM="Gambierdiscus australes, Strain CAWD 149" /LENGTH=64 /DNA_ID=CAMNT_0011539279 /DNA_START=82 /DNA_END=273 /DNA_ORIENTATION=-